MPLINNPPPSHHGLSIYFLLKHINVVMKCLKVLKFKVLVESNFQKGRRLRKLKQSKTELVCAIFALE